MDRLVRALVVIAGILVAAGLQVAILLLQERPDPPPAPVPSSFGRRA